MSAFLSVRQFGKMNSFYTLKQEIKYFMKNFYSWLQTMIKTGLVWLSRPLFICLVIRSKFGPFRPKISQIRGRPQLFIGPLDFTYPQVFKIALVFVGAFFSIFDLGQNLNGDLCVYVLTLVTLTNKCLLLFDSMPQKMLVSFCRLLRWQPCI